MKTFYYVLIFSLISIFLSAAIINVPADQPTIQQGIDVSVNADTVLVQPGTYVENINYNGKKHLYFLQPRMQPSYHKQ